MGSGERRRSRVATSIHYTMKEGKDSDTPFARSPAMVCLREEIRDTATKLLNLANLNRTVHLPTYNKLIGETALALAV